MFDSIRTYIANSQTQEALGTIMSISAKHKVTVIQNKINIVHGQFSRIESDFKQGFLSYADRDVFLNRIHSTILCFCDDLLLELKSLKKKVQDVIKINSSIFIRD
jgi:hypothetical protein